MADYQAIEIQFVILNIKKVNESLFFQSFVTLQLFKI